MTEKRRLTRRDNLSVSATIKPSIASSRKRKSFRLRPAQSSGACGGGERTFSAEVILPCSDYRNALVVSFLRGAGVVLTLPLLDAMTPATCEKRPPASLLRE